MAPFSISAAHFIGIFVGAIAFGIHIITFAYCIRTLTTTRSGWRKRGDIKWLMLAVSLSLFIIAMSDIILDFYQSLNILIINESTKAIEEARYLQISGWMNVTKVAFVLFQSAIGDAFLVYRCWVIYNGYQPVLIIPIVLWVACLSSTLWIVSTEATLHSSGSLGAKQVRPSGVLTLGLTVAINIVTTGLLLWKIWSVAKLAKQEEIPTALREGDRKSSSLRQVMRIIIDSGLMYTTTAFMTFVSFSVGSNFTYTITAILIQVVGIAFNLIIIRAARISDQMRDGNASSTVIQFAYYSTATTSVLGARTGM